MIEWIKRFYKRRFGSQQIRLRVYKDKRGHGRVQGLDYSPDPIRRVLSVTTGAGYKEPSDAKLVAEQIAKRENIGYVINTDKNGRWRFRIVDSETGKILQNTSGNSYQTKEEVETIVNRFQDARITIYNEIKIERDSWID